MRELRLLGRAGASRSGGLRGRRSAAAATTTAGSDGTTRPAGGRTAGGATHRGTNHATARSDDHDHATAFHHRALFDQRDVGHGADHLVEHRLTGLRVNDLTAAKDDDQLALVALGEERADVLHLEVEVVVVGLRAELDLLEHDRRLMAARGLLLLRCLVLELPKVHDLADRRRRAWVHLDQLETRLLGELHRLVGGDDADLAAVGADHAHLGHTNTTPDAIVVRDAGRSLIEWPSDDRSPGGGVFSSL